MGVEYVKTLTKLREILLIFKNTSVVIIKRVGSETAKKFAGVRGRAPEHFGCQHFAIPNRFENEIEFFSL